MSSQKIESKLRQGQICFGSSSSDLWFHIFFPLRWCAFRENLSWVSHEGDIRWEVMWKQGGILYLCTYSSSPNMSHSKKTCEKKEKFATAAVVWVLFLFGCRPRNEHRTEDVLDLSLYLIYTTHSRNNSVAFIKFAISRFH